MRQLVYSQFVVCDNNNLVPLRLWWEETTLKDKQDSLSTLNLCDRISEQWKASYFISDFPFLKGLPKFMSSQTKQWGVYATKTAAITLNFNTASCKGYRWCSITYFVLMGKKEYTVQGFSEKTNAVFQPSLYVTFLIWSLSFMLLNLLLYFLRRTFKLYLYTI